MIRRQTEKTEFLRGHVPGMREMHAPRPGSRAHASYLFKPASYPKGHVFIRQGEVAEDSIFVVYKGSVEICRAEPPPRRRSKTPSLKQRKEVWRNGGQSVLRPKRGVLLRGQDE